MAVYSHPGVYVEEVPGGARSIEAAGTSTPIFVGETERGPSGPVKIRGRAGFERLFGGYWRHDSSGKERVDLAYALDLFFANGGRDAYILRAIDSNAQTASETFNLQNADPNGSGTMELSASAPGVWANNDLKIAFPSASNDTFTLEVSYQPSWMEEAVVEVWSKLSLDPSSPNYAPEVLRRSLFVRMPKDQIGAALGTGAPMLPEGPLIGAPAVGLTSNTGTGGDARLGTTAFGTLLEQLDEITDASLLVVPDLRLTDNAQAGATARLNAALGYATNRPQRDLFLVADLPQQTQPNASQAATAVEGVLSEFTGDRDMLAAYWPWVEVADPVGLGRHPTLTVPPSGAVAGVYGRTDTRRGVWKAPAGVEASVMGISGIDYDIYDGIQGDLNPDGINVIRSMPGAGPVVWGARTLKPNSEWRYVPVRRTAMFLRKSIYNGIQWAVFEPNGQTLWSSLTLTIEAFMEQQFRRGAFAGATSDEAYFVKCDEETTPELDQAAGIVNVWVGFAPLRPAEFVVVKLKQMVDQSA